MITTIICMEVILVTVRTVTAVAAKNLNSLPRRQSIINLKLKLKRDYQH